MGWVAEIAGKNNIDPDGQPLNPRYRAHAVESRQIDELIGLVKGVLADGAICQSEIEFLLKWMQANESITDQWPAIALYPRIVAALADGHLDSEEERDIMQLLMSAVGSNSAPTADAPSASSTLPLCHPQPVIEYPERIFCFTGKFHSGTRSWCEEQVGARGATAVGTITKKLNYLVIGEIGSRDWLHSTHGLKIQKAVEYRALGVPLRIISEQHWFARLST